MKSKRADIKIFQYISVSEAASTNMKACWLFIGEWAFAGIAAPNFQALLCNVINNFFTNRRIWTMRKNRKDKRNYLECCSDIIRNHRITQTKLFFYGLYYYVLSSLYYTYMSLRVRKKLVRRNQDVTDLIWNAEDQITFRPAFEPSTSHI